MPTLRSTVTGQGQVILPKKIMSMLTLQSGDRIEFIVDDAGRIVLSNPSTAGSSAGCGKRFLKRGQKPVSLEAMKAAVVQCAAAKFGSRARGKA